MGFDWKTAEEEIKNGSNGGNFIEEKGYSVGEIISAKEKKSKSSEAEWLELTIKTKEGQMAYFKIFFTNGQGKPLGFGMKTIHDICTVLEIGEQVEEFGLETALKEAEGMIGITYDASENEFNGETRMELRLLAVRDPYTLLGPRDRNEANFYWEEKLEIGIPTEYSKEEVEEVEEGDAPDTPENEDEFPF